MAGRANGDPEIVRNSAERVVGAARRALDAIGIPDPLPNPVNA